MRKIIAGILVVVSTSASAVDCGGWWMGGGCQPGVGSPPSNYTWNPLWGDGQVVGAGAATFGIAAVAGGLFGIISEAIAPSNSVYTDAGTPSQQLMVSTSGVPMYQRKDVYDMDCDCYRSLLVRIQ